MGEGIKAVANVRETGQNNDYAHAAAYTFTYHPICMQAHTHEPHRPIYMHE